MKKRVVVFMMLLCIAAGMMTGCASKPKLKVFLPSTYHDQAVITKFEKEHNCRVIIETFESNEMMYTKIAAGDSYDVLIPSDYMIERLINEDMLQPIDKSKMDFSVLADEVVDPAYTTYDPDNTYSVPYFWGTAGIIYDKTVVDKADLESEGWNIFLDTKYKGKVYLYDSERDAFIMPFKALGYSMNTENADEIEAAYQWYLQCVKTMDTEIVTDEVIDNMVQGKKALALVYSGDAAYIISENENMGFYMPTQGTNVFIDAMVIPKTSENYDLANDFIAYLTTYEAAKANSIEVGYASNNKEVLLEMSGEGGDYYGNEAYYPQVSENDETFNDSEVLRTELSKYWLKIKTAAE